MCYFITVAATADKAEALRNVRKGGIEASPYTNRHLSRQLPEGCQTFALTSGGCSCDLYAGGSDNDEPDRGDLTRLRKKYEKKGWPEAKIERAIGNPEHRLRQRQPFVGLRPDVRSLLADIVEQCGELAIVIHFYSGNVEDEHITLQQSDHISPSDLRDATRTIAEDTIVWVRRPRPHQTLR